MSKAYVVANVKVTDPQQYEQYRIFSSQAMQESGCEVLVRGGDCHPLEGTDPNRVVILGFDSLKAAQDFYESETYKKGRQARANAAEMTMYIVEGV